MCIHVRQVRSVCSALLSICGLSFVSRETYICGTKGSWIAKTSAVSHLLSYTSWQLMWEKFISDWLLSLLQQFKEKKLDCSPYYKKPACHVNVPTVCRIGGTHSFHSKFSTQLILSLRMNRPSCSQNSIRKAHIYLHSS